MDKLVRHGESTSGTIYPCIERRIARTNTPLSPLDRGETWRYSPLKRGGMGVCIHATKNKKTYSERERERERELFCLNDISPLFTQVMSYFEAKQLISHIFTLGKGFSKKFSKNQGGHFPLHQRT